MEKLKSNSQLKEYKIRDLLRGKTDLKIEYPWTVISRSSWEPVQYNILTSSELEKYKNSKEWEIQYNFDKPIYEDSIEEIDAEISSRILHNQNYINNLIESGHYLEKYGEQTIILSTSKLFDKPVIKDDTVLESYRYTVLNFSDKDKTNK